jgi:hypothetical protein
MGTLSYIRDSHEYFKVLLWHPGDTQPIPVAARSKLWVCGRSLAAIVGSNPAGGMDVCFECCVLSGKGPCDELITRSEESYRLCVF